MPWVLLLIAGVFEMLFVLALGQPGAFRALRPTAVAIGVGAVSVFLLALAMRDLPVGTAYAVWAAIGAGGGVILGILFRGDPRDGLRLGGLATIIGGVVLLKLAEG